MNKALKCYVFLLTLWMGTTPVFADELEYYIVLGSFDSESAAKTYATNVNRSIPCKIVPTNVDGRKLYRVQVDSAESYAGAEIKRQAISKQGYASAWIHQRQVEDVTQARALPVSESPQSPVAEVRKPERKISQLRHVVIGELGLDSPILNDEIDDLADDYLERKIQVSELLKLKESINQLFAVKGYINTGVVIPDQKISEGKLRFKLIEGEISNLDVESELNDSYIKGRVSITEPFNLMALQESLKLLEKDPFVKRIDANITPGKVPGEADLTLAVDTHPKFNLGFYVANNRSPSIGAYNAAVSIETRNLTGWGETLKLKTSATEGLDSHDARFSIPFNRHDHRISLSYSLSDSAVIEEPFNEIGVKSATESFGLNFNFPIIKTLRSNVDLQLTFESRKNDTSLLGIPFSFSEGAVNGESKVTPVRLALLYSKTGVSQAVAARLAISKGTKAFGATKNNNQADGDFTSYLAQAQFSRQFSEQFYVTTKLLAQYATSTLLSIEKFSLGGISTVRGYRENQIVRDNAYLATIEARFRPDTEQAMEFIGFFDWGSGKNHDDAIAQGKDTIYGAGVGISYQGLKGLTADVFYAHAFKDFKVTEKDLQDEGFHFRLRYNYAF